MANKRDKETEPLYLSVFQEMSGEYFHVRARIVTQKYRDNGYEPDGCDDHYSDGPKYNGLRAACQGDSNSRRKAESPVYGFNVEYRDVHSIDLRDCKRMYKTLDTIDRKMTKLQDARGYVKSFGEYLGRVAEALGCIGMVYQRSDRAIEMSGYRWEWTSIGDGVNRANSLIWKWTQDGIESARPVASGE